MREKMRHHDLELTIGRDVLYGKSAKQ